MLNSSNLSHDFDRWPKLGSLQKRNCCDRCRRRLRGKRFKDTGGHICEGIGSVCRREMTVGSQLSVSVNRLIGPSSSVCRLTKVVFGRHICQFLCEIISARKEFENLFVNFLWFLWRGDKTHPHVFSISYNDYILATWQTISLTRKDKCTWPCPFNNWFNYH